MKVTVYVSTKIKMEVNDKFKELLEEENDKLENELLDIILADENILGVNGIYDESEEVLIGEY